MSNEVDVGFKVSHVCGNPNCDWSPKKNIHGIDVEFDGKAFTFKYNDRIAGPYPDIYQLEPSELAEKLGIENEKASFARMTALQIYQDREYGIEDLVNILGLTVRHDDINKVITFLVMLSAFTPDNQLNLSFRAESSTGKSYLPLQISMLFPQDRIVKIAYSSPTAFYHDRGVIDEETKEVVIDLEKRILIFLDQPHDQLLERLRPLLSHDQKELHYKITDKREKSGLRTKNVKIVGFPAVIFCTGRLRVDEQEATRMIILSPEVSQEKFREAIYLKALKEADREAFEEYVEEDPKRKALRERLREISRECVGEIRIPDPEKVAERFIKGRKVLKPRHMRDIEKIINLAKAMALLNYKHRETEKNGDRLIIYVSEKDVDTAFKLWSEIEVAQELSLPPFTLEVLEKVIKPLAEENLRNYGIIGATRSEILERFLQVFGRPLSRTVLDKEILPALVSTGLVDLEPHPKDKRKTLIVPLTLRIETLPHPEIPHISEKVISEAEKLEYKLDQRYVGFQGGVESKDKELSDFKHDETMYADRGVVSEDKELEYKLPEEAMWRPGHGPCEYCGREVSKRFAVMTRHGVKFLCRECASEVVS